MRLALVICDGMADNPADFKDGMTPLARAYTPNMDFFVRNGRSGNLTTIPAGKYAGSETAILTILGYYAEELPKGQRSLEASGAGIGLLKDEYASRYLLAATPGRPRRHLSALKESSRIPRRFSASQKP